MNKNTVILDIERYHQLQKCEDKLKENKAILRDMITKKQVEIPIDGAAEKILKRINLC